MCSCLPGGAGPARARCAVGRRMRWRGNLPASRRSAASDGLRLGSRSIPASQTKISSVDARAGCLAACGGRETGASTAAHHARASASRSDSRRRAASSLGARDQRSRTTARHRLPSSRSISNCVKIPLRSHAVKNRRCLALAPFRQTQENRDEATRPACASFPDGRMSRRAPLAVADRDESTPRCR